MGAGRPADALVAYRTALELDPGYASALTNVGVLQFQRGELDAAIESFEASLEVAPESADTLTNLAYALDAKGDRAAAVARFEEALALEPRHFQAHNNLGMTLYELVGRTRPAPPSRARWSSGPTTARRTSTWRSS